MDQQTATSGIYPTTIEDINNQQSSRNSHGGGVWMKKSETATSNKETMSAISSTRSEYGSSDSNSGTDTSQRQRPVADKDAFIQSGEIKRHWQYSMTPAQRAKELAAEMNENIARRGSSQE